MTTLEQVVALVRAGVMSPDLGARILVLTATQPLPESIPLSAPKWMLDLWPLVSGTAATP